MHNNVRAVIFDLDGVVAFTDRYHFQAWEKVCAENGWRFDEKLNNKLRGVPRDESLLIILKHNNITLSDDKRREIADRKNEYYKDLLTHIGQSDLYPGIVEFIQELRSRKVKLALCSSSKNAEMVLSKLRLKDHFDVIITGNDFSKAKPDPEIFLKGAKLLHVHPFHCLVFEDAQAGVDAALNGGMRCIGVCKNDMELSAAQTIGSYDEIDIESLLFSGRKTFLEPEEWNVSETSFEPKRAEYWESIFALTNGYMGMRGTYEEDDDHIRPYSYPAMFLNGIYDYQKWNHTASFPGYAQRRHVMLNLCDWRIIEVFVDGEKFSMFDGVVSHYRRTLDMRNGVVVRSLVWESPKGKRVRIKTTRIVSMTHEHNAAIRYEVTPLNAVNEIVFKSRIKHHITSRVLKERLYKLVGKQAKDEIHCFSYRTSGSNFAVSMAVSHCVGGGDCRATAITGNTDEEFAEEFHIDAVVGKTAVLDKHACFYTSIETPETALVDAATTQLQTVLARGFEYLQSEQSEFWKKYWDIADIVVNGNVPDQQALRLGIFHLRQSVPNDGQRSISACGLTGDEYWGLVFWDTEMYMCPPLLYTEPEKVRTLLMYRYNILDEARNRARQMDGIGALYSWCSISGEECSIFYEAATAQYHLQSDIAYAIWRYFSGTGDIEFLCDYGAEIVFETARFLFDRGKFIPSKGFCINSVCGPDEYACGVNNNCYTNTLVQWHFNFACQIYDMMSREHGEKFADLAKKIQLGSDERGKWQKAADEMYLPYNVKLGIDEQDDSFLYNDPVDMDIIPQNVDLRNYFHPLNLWRMQVSKQADVVLLMFILSWKYSKARKSSNYEFYEPRTCHGSSLSPSIHSIIASEIGKDHDAYEYFVHSAYMDICDLKDNTSGGIHTASSGGTWMAVVNGFAGMRDEPDGLRFDPVVPGSWESYSFKLLYKGRIISVDVNKNQVVYRLLCGDTVEFQSYDQKIILSMAASETQDTLNSKDRADVLVDKVR